MRLILLISIIFINYSFYRQTQPETIIWTKDKLLTWDNFKGLPDTSNKYAAVTNCNIKTNFRTKKDTLFISAVSYMQPSMSWVKSKSKNTNLLKHEQVHFDITELSMRKLRQTILSTKFIKKQIGNDLNKMTDIYTQAFKQYGALYDLETNHGLIKAKQTEWEKKIAKELKNLEAYSITELKILIN